jgi:hypothetical protein
VSATTPEPPSAPPAARPPDEAASAAARDTAAIRAVLTRYGNAFSGLNAAAVGEVWPSVDERALERAFRGLQEQDVAFDNCQVGVNGADATATCSGTVRYVTRIGSRTPRMEHRVWQFTLRRAGAGWLIDRVNSK